MAMGPRQFEDPIGKMPILVFPGQAQGGLARGVDAGDHVYDCRLVRLECNSIADRDNRIQHRACAARQRRGIVHRLWRCHGAPATDEVRAVRFVRNRAHLRPAHGQQVKHPRRRLAQGARPARTENRVLLRDDFSLHKEIGERRMQCVRGRYRENDFSVTRDLNGAPETRAVCNMHPAQFDVVFR